MSLTNDQITAQNFKTFYEGIRPYLNGSFPTPIANKFSKGDLYSTDEKLIGQWIDGKPLYQKYIEVPSKGSTWQNIYEESGIEIKSCPLIQLYWNDSNITWMPMPYYGSSDAKALYGIKGSAITASTTKTGTSYPICMVIQYTKTADSAIAIGNDTDYSTTEKIVGTWIDGKPVYQKVIDCGALPNNTTKLVDISDLGMDLCISIEGLTYNSSYGYTIPKVSTGAHVAEFWIDRSTNKINIRTTSNESAYDHTYAIIQYTKTTD